MKSSACWNCHDLSSFRRRDLLRAGGLSLFGLSTAGLLEGRQAAASMRTSSDPLNGSFGKAKACILLFMWGGPAHQETWDLKPNAPSEIRGEFKPIPTVVPGIEIGEHFPLLAQRTDQLAIIRSMTHEDVNHTTATHYLQTGQPSPPLGNDLRHDWPSFGAVLSKIGRGNGPLPPYVTMRPKLENDVPRFVEESHGQTAGWLGQNFDPLSIDVDPNRADYRVGDFELLDGISVSRLDHRQQLLSQIEQQRRALESAGSFRGMPEHYVRAFNLLNSSTGGDAFDLSRESPEMRDRYGRNPHGQSVLQARRLIERGVPLVTIFWPSDGTKNVSVYWDTHSRNFTDLKTRLMPPADMAFSALLDDLGQRGMLDETLVVWTGEFGRTPRVGQRNSDAGAGKDGRDHWPNCFSTVLAGAGVKKGMVYGSSDKHAAYPASNALHPVDLVATLNHALGVSPDLMLSDVEGRELLYCPGTPVLELLG